MSIDNHLNEYAAEILPLPEGGKYQWWWNADNILAAAISSAVEHLRTEGCTAYTPDELVELKTLERFMRAYADEFSDIPLDPAVFQWLFAEAMWLLSKWFVRLWD